jgi:hypothetical protein
MESYSEINEKYREIEGIFVSYNSFGRMEEEKRHEINRVTCRRLKGSHWNFGKS